MRHLDTDDHERLLDENREAYARERAEDISFELYKIERALSVVSVDEVERLQERRESLLCELDEIKRQFE